MIDDWVAGAYTSVIVFGIRSAMTAFGLVVP
jgi:hypothetical protein